MTSSVRPGAFDARDPGRAALVELGREADRLIRDPDGRPSGRCEIVELEPVDVARCRSSGRIARRPSPTAAAVEQALGGVRDVGRGQAPVHRGVDRADARVGVVPGAEPVARAADGARDRRDQLRTGSPLMTVAVHDAAAARLVDSDRGAGRRPRRRARSTSRAQISTVVDADDALAVGRRELQLEARRVLVVGRRDGARRGAFDRLDLVHVAAARAVQEDHVPVQAARSGWPRPPRPSRDR